jgi:small subunit ribosomal protein S4
MLDTKCRKCRRAGEKLFLKGEKCFSPKCTFTRKPYPPGILGKKKSKHGARGLSEFGLQLKERQKIKFGYGVRGRQFENYLKEAKKTSSESSSIINILESRLDNVVFRMGLSESRNGARQIVSHGHILVNGKKIDIPSYRTKINDKILIKPQSLNKGIFKDLEIKIKKYNPPAWLKLDKVKKEAEIIGKPTI